MFKHLCCLTYLFYWAHVHNSVSLTSMQCTQSIRVDHLPLRSWCLSFWLFSVSLCSIAIDVISLIHLCFSVVLKQILSYPKSAQKCHVPICDSFLQDYLMLHGICNFENGSRISYVMLGRICCTLCNFFPAKDTCFHHNGSIFHSVRSVFWNARFKSVIIVLYWIVHLLTLACSHLQQTLMMDLSNESFLS